jgi:hypothetical protein
VQVSAGDRRLPEWSTDRRRLFYRARNRMMVVDVSTRVGLEVSTLNVILNFFTELRQKAPAR